MRQPWVKSLITHIHYITQTYTDTHTHTVVEKLKFSGTTLEKSFRNGQKETI
jgi:hypothetical protein